MAVWKSQKDLQQLISNTTAQKASYQLNSNKKADCTVSQYIKGATKHIIKKIKDE